jgi:hypothetical protein
LHENADLTTAEALSLRWEEPSDTQGAPILDYKVYWKPSASTDDFVPLTLDHTETTLTITKDENDIETGGSYDFKVLARNSQGDGDFSEPISIIAA